MASIGDIKQVVAQDEEGAEIPIYQKSGEPYMGLDGEPSVFIVVGTESKQYRAAKRAHLARLHKRARRRSGTTAPPEEMERDALELVAASVIGFRGWDDGKAELAFTPDNVRALLAFDHIFDQVNVGIQAHADFFSASSRS